MKKDKQITDIHQLSGKTIARAMFLGCWDEIGIVFDDGTFLYIDIYGDREGYELTINSTLEFDDAVKMGLMTEEEIAEHEAAEEAKRKARELREREEKVQLYERLKKELGKGN